MASLSALIGGIAGGSLTEVAGALAGAAKPLLEDAAEATRWHARAYLSGPPGNHDIEKGLHAAWLTGILAVLRQHEIAVLGDRAPKPGSLAERYDRLLRGLEKVLDLGHPDPAHLEIWHVRDWCHKQLDRLGDLAEADDTTALGLFETALTPAFAQPAPPDARIDKARDEAWRRLEAGVGERGVRLPATFKARFDSTDPKAPGWFGCFFAYVQEELKRKESRLRTAFFARQGALTQEMVRRLAEDQATEAKRAADADAATNAKLDAIIAALRRSGLVVQAEAEGLAERTILAFAQRLRPEEAHDFYTAVRAVEHAVEIALDLMRRGQQAGSNQDAFVGQVLAKVARRNQAGDLDGGAQAVDEAMAELDRRSAEHREAIRRSRETVLQTGIAQQILRRDAAAVARHVETLVALDVPDGRAPWSSAFRERWDSFFDEGHDKGLNLSLEIAIALARRMVATAKTADEWGTASNLLGNALRALGARESSTGRLVEAVIALRAALEGFTRERVPFDWARTQNNLGAALRTLGERESGIARLAEAVAAYRAALEVRTRDRVPLAWAGTQNNLGNVLQTLGARESGTARLEEAVVAYRAALEEWTRERVPLNWATAQNNLGAALQTIGERESGRSRLEEAVAVFCVALEERTRERVPLDWAMTQNNLGDALRTLGERESGTARLEAAIASF